MDKSKKSFFSLEGMALTPLRLTIYCAFFISLLLGIIGYTIIQKNNEWENLNQRIEGVFFLTQKAAFKQKEAGGIKVHYKNANTHYLQKQLESWLLLEKEQKNIVEVIDSPGFCGNKALEERLRFLKSPLNSIKFKEQSLYSSSSFKETEVSLTHPVESSLEDIEGILKKVEEDEEKKPLLITTQFHLKRKKPIDHNEVFEINFTILKREFLDS